MQEKLIIRNFGPIKHIEFELKKFNILIGEQATGKSTVAKVLAVCRYFSYILAENGNNFISDNSFEIGLQAWGLQEYIQNNSFISYDCEHYFFQTKRTLLTEKDFHNHSNAKFSDYYFKSELKPKSDVFIKLLKEYNKIKEQEKNIGSDGKYWLPPTSFFLNDVNAVMDNPFYSPAERGLQSVFSLGKDFSSNLTNFLFRYFAKSDDFIRFFQNQTEIEPLNIYYRYAVIPEIRKKTDKNFIRLHNAASGYQSTIPFILAIKYYHEYKNKKKTFIIEEPEQNLFPATQYELIKFFAKYLKYHNSFLITTHSPYILTSLNNLLYAYSVGKIREKENKVSLIIDKKVWINSKDVSAYKLLTNGFAEDILDKESALIKAEEIDTISSEINNEYDKISELKYGK